MDAALQARVERLLGTRVLAARAVEGGYTPAARWVVSLADGRSSFVKAATNASIAGWLRAEHRVYRAVEAPWLARLEGWDDDGTRPVLALEDLSGARWPPPWRQDDVAAVVAALAAFHDSPPPPGLPPASALFRTDGWERVAADPGSLLALRLVPRGWLDRALPTLVAAEAAFRLEGDSLVHLDVRSDNLCLRDGGAVLVDWNHASTGNPEIDLAFWLPSLELEGGPPPEALLPGAPEAAAVVSGYFAARAGLPPVAMAPRVRPVQLAQLRTALPWAQRALGLEAFDAAS